MSNSRSGMLILFAAAICFSFMALAAKGISPEVGAPQVLVARSVLMALVVGVWARRRGEPLFGRQDRKLLFIRGLLGTLGFLAFFGALKRLPLADTVLIFQSHPMIVALLGPLMLKEKNRAVQWLLLAVSLAGVAMVVGPTGAGSWTGRLMALACAFCAGTAYAMVRLLRRSETPLTIVFAFPSVTLVLLGPLLAVGIPGFRWVTPSSVDWALLAVVGGAATLGQVLLTVGLGRVPAAKGTAISNTQVAIAMFLGYLFLSEVPSPYTLIGAAVIVTAVMLLSITSDGQERLRASAP